MYGDKKRTTKTGGTEGPFKERRSSILPFENNWSLVKHAYGEDLNPLSSHIKTALHGSIGGSPDHGGARNVSTHPMGKQTRNASFTLSQQILL